MRNFQVTPKSDPLYGLKVVIDMTKLLALTSYSYTKSSASFGCDFNGSTFSTTIWYRDVDFTALEAKYGKETIERLIFHIAAFDINKVCSLKPDQVSFGPLARFCTEAFKTLWLRIFKEVWGQWRYENNLPNYSGPEFIDKTEGFSGSTAVNSNAGAVRVLSFCGGGKDSLVVLKLLEHSKEPYSTLAYSHSIYGEPVKQHRLIDSLLDTCEPVRRHKQWVIEDFMTSPVLELNNPNGVNTLCAAETPGSIFAALPLVLSFGYSYLVLGHEKSADYGNMVWGATGETINHQWGKSYEAELLMHEYIKRELIRNLEIGSLLKPIHDTLIFELLKSHEDGVLHTHSCNIDKPWCKRCAKCAYVWINYMAFLPVSLVDAIFGENLLDVEENQIWFRQMLGLDLHTPFECVGQPDEALIAFELARLKGIRGKGMDIYEESFPSIDFAPLIKRYLAVDADHSALPKTLLNLPLARMIEVAAESERELMALLVDSAAKVANPTS